MRIFLALTVALLLLNAGCIQRGKEAQPAAPLQPSSAGLYTGYPDYEPGMWVVYRIFGGAKIKFEVVGKETFNEREALGFEMSVLDAEASITQAWFTKSGELVKYAIKRGGQVTCILELGAVNRAALPFVGEGWKSTPPEFEGEREYEQVQSIANGAKINIARFSSPVGEAWVSGEVPFGVVKELQDDEVISELYDYGSSGATRDISLEELLNCWKFDVKRAIPQYQ
ncbi:MAG: hypothetical protein ACE5G7_01945 [Candidatus Hydrothermarchaeaceae archaeon]